MPKGIRIRSYPSGKRAIVIAFTFRGVECRETSKGDATMTTHNEHNGYYGGFWPVMQAWNPTQNRA